jgi:hypothetical protein
MLSGEIQLHPGTTENRSIVSVVMLFDSDLPVEPQQFFLRQRKVYTSNFLQEGIYCALVNGAKILFYLFSDRVHQLTVLGLV